MRFKTLHNQAGVILLKDTAHEKSVIDRIITGRRINGTLAVIRRVCVLKISHRPKVRHTKTAHPVNRRAVGPQNVVHRMRRGANVAQTKGVMAQKMRQPAYAPHSPALRQRCPNGTCRRRQIAALRFDKTRWPPQKRKSLGKSERLKVKLSSVWGRACASANR